MLKLSILQQIFETHKNIPAIIDLLSKHKDIYVKGLQGSSASMFATALFHKTDSCYLFVLNDLESAGYFYHDLNQILDSDKVLFFPSAYKRAIKYGQIDAANEILRTEVMGQLQVEDKNLIIVTYPEALAEKAVAKDILKKNTIQMSVDEEIDRNFVSEMLDSFGFEYVDYVYEPGQYAIRGSILDVFSFSSEYPYRIDFFGDEVSTIRTFDIETQLSKEKLNQIQIIPDMQKSNMDRESLLKLIPKDTVVAFKDFVWARDKVESVYNDSTILDNPEYEKDLQNKLTLRDEYDALVKGFKHIHFGNKIQAEAVVEFKTDIQPSFHKNFDLISETLHKYLDKDYTIYIK